MMSPLTHLDRHGFSQSSPSSQRNPYLRRRRRKEKKKKKKTRCNAPRRKSVTFPSILGQAPGGMERKAIDLFLLLEESSTEA